MASKKKENAVDTNNLTITFIKKRNAPESLQAEGELTLPSPLGELKLIGISVWRTANGSLSVTLPARTFTVGSERRYIEYLRSAKNGTFQPVRRFKEWVLEEFAKRGVTTVSAEEQPEAHEAQEASAPAQ